MKFKNEILKNSKKIVGTALLSSLLVAQTVGATGTVADSVKSKGNIEYDANGDGSADVYFYSKDLTAIGSGIDSLNENMVSVGDALVELKETTIKYKTDIISGLNGNVYAKNKISSDASFEDIISKIRNIPTPTTAVGTYTSSGDNSGLNTGISSSTKQTNVDIDGVTSLNLAVNEAITLPSGYYPNDITIKNNVVNRGSLSFNPSRRSSSSVSAGYYTGGTLSSSNAYDQGYRDGEDSIVYSSKKYTSNGTYSVYGGVSVITIDVQAESGTDSSPVSGTYTYPNGSKGETKNIASYEYVNAENVYQQGYKDGSNGGPSVSGTYTYPTGSKGETQSVATYEYVNAENVYQKGKKDGYDEGYEKGKEDAAKDSSSDNITGRVKTIIVRSTSTWGGGETSGSMKITLYYNNDGSLSKITGEFVWK